jgi:RNA polymerase sigma-70 factor (ECF subfamily)
LEPTAWVDRHGDMLYRYALARLRDPEAAEEVVQETFVAALRAVEQYSGKGAEGAWLLGILKRKIVDQVRRRSRPDSAAGGDADADPSRTLFDAKGNWRADARFCWNRPDASLEREEFWDAFRRCLERLPRRQADVFALRELDELDTEEICKGLQITASNLWVLLHRARLYLTRCMQSHQER